MSVCRRRTGAHPLSVDNEVSLAWLAEALQQLRPEGQKKVVGYLEAVLEEVVFETKMVPGAYPRSVTYPSEGV
jgi:hypothetical protein